MNEIYVFMSVHMYCNPFTGVYAYVCRDMSVVNLRWVWQGTDTIFIYFLLTCFIYFLFTLFCFYRYRWKDVDGYVCCHVLGDDHYYMPLLSKAFKWGGTPHTPLDQQCAKSLAESLTLKSNWILKKSI